MAIRRKTIAYYSCDRCRFQEQETAKHCPEGWRYLNTLIPGEEKQQPEIKALICPTCDEWLKQQLDAICIQDKQGEEEEAGTAASARPPFRHAPGAEQRKPAAIDPIRRLFEQGEEEVEIDSSECAPFLRSSKSEPRRPSAIDPIRRLFEQGEEEEVDTHSSEDTPSLHSSGSEHPMPPSEEVESDSNQRTTAPLSSGSEQREPPSDEAEAGSSECIPSPLPSGAEQRDLPAEQVEVESSECPPSPLSSGSEQREPSSIDPIRRLFREGNEEVETAGSEYLPSLVSYGTKPSPMDSIRKLIQHR